MFGSAKDYMKKCSKCQRFTHNDLSESSLYGFYPGGYSSQSTAYAGPALTVTPRGSPLKDGDSPTMTARSSAHGYPSESTAYIGSYPDGFCSTPYPGYVPRYVSQIFFDHIAQFFLLVCVYEL